MTLQATVQLGLDFATVGDEGTLSRLEFEVAFTNQLAELLGVVLERVACVWCSTVVLERDAGARCLGEVLERGARTWCSSVVLERGVGTWCGSAVLERRARVFRAERARVRAQQARRFLRRYSAAVWSLAGDPQAAVWSDAGRASARCLGSLPAPYVSLPKSVRCGPQPLDRPWVYSEGVWGTGVRFAFLLLPRLLHL